LESLNFNLLHLMGIGYVIDHCVSYSQDKRDRKILELYITDALKIITENTAKSVEGTYLTVRYSDIVNPTKDPTQEEIIDGIRAKLGKC